MLALRFENKGHKSNIDQTINVPSTAALTFLIKSKHPMAWFLFFSQVDWDDRWDATDNVFRV